MKRLPETIEMLKAKRTCPAAECGVAVIDAFGSLIRNEQHPGSDIDVPTEMERFPRISLIGPVEPQDHSPDVFAIRVDVDFKRNLRKRIVQRKLMRELRRGLGKGRAPHDAARQQDGYLYPGIRR
jgi:predicted nucleotidyltransferase